MHETSSIAVRDLKDLADLREVIEIEKRVWGYPDAEEAVPLPILAAGVRRGAIVLGAFDGHVMVGASYSFPAIRDGRLTHWSHMLGVLQASRSGGVGRLLKLQQRQRALALGVDLIEWTFDPLQAANAHFNLVRLGAVVEEYDVNVYGESTSPLWRGTQSDRFIAQWYIRQPHVERRLARRGPIVRASQTLAAVPVLEARCAGDLPEPGALALEEDGPRLRVEIPQHFAPIQIDRPDLARTWRAATRAVFTTYLPRGYRVIDFWLDRRRACGTYLLARHDVAQRREAA
jgi:predicted GNAT superfamily acetyltransferase